MNILKKNGKIFVMKKLLTTKEVNNFKVDGAVVLRKKFDIHWIKKLKKGIRKDLKSPSPRLVSHTKKLEPLLILKIIGPGTYFLNLKILYSIRQLVKLLRNYYQQKKLIL